MDAAFGGLYVVAAYFMGAIPVAYLYGRARHTDISTSGSRNLGAGNTTRLLGTKAGALVALLDGLKGLITVIAGRSLGFSSSVVVFGTLATVAGSDWSVFLGGRSGRGLATSSLAMLAFDPITVIWPSLWSVIGWKIGGGISGFFGWAFIWVAAYGLGRPTETVLLGAGLGLLMIIRRAQGNLNDPDQEEPLARVLFDTDRRSPSTELVTGDSSLA